MKSNKTPNFWKVLLVRFAIIAPLVSFVTILCFKAGFEFAMMLIPIVPLFVTFIVIIILEAHAGRDMNVGLLLVAFLLSVFIALALTLPFCREIFWGEVVATILSVIFINFLYELFTCRKYREDSE